MELHELRMRIQDRIETELDSIGVEMIEQSRDYLSIDVEVLEGGTIIRSRRGESPRRETHHLQNSHDHTVNNGTLVVENTAAYAVELEQSMSRPFFSRVKNDFAPVIGQRLVEAIEGRR